MSAELISNDKLRVVTSNDFITAEGLAVLTTKERKLLYLAIAQCELMDDTFYEYRVTVSDFAKLMNIEPDHVYEQSEEICDHLFSGVLKYKNPLKKKRDTIHLFKRCTYDNGLITFKLSDEMTPFLLDLKSRFSQPLLSDFLALKSANSIAIWHLMQREMGSKKPLKSEKYIFELSLDELHRVTGINDKSTYRLLSHFKQRILDVAIKHIRESCMIDITYENKKTGRTVTGFRFTAKRTDYLSPKDISESDRQRTAALLKRIADQTGRTQDKQALDNYLLTFATDGIKKSKRTVKGTVKSKKSKQTQ